MKKVNLEEAFEEWEQTHEQKLMCGFIERNEMAFDDYREMLWREYQEEHGLVDESNDDVEDREEEE